MFLWYFYHNHLVKQHRNMPHKHCSVCIPYWSYKLFGQGSLWVHMDISIIVSSHRPHKKNLSRVHELLVNQQVQICVYHKYTCHRHTFFGRFYHPYCVSVLQCLVTDWNFTKTLLWVLAICLMCLESLTLLWHNYNMLPSRMYR